MVSITDVILGGFFLEQAAIFGFITWYFIFYPRRWPIPVVILRFLGDKRRPQVLLTRGRRDMRTNVARLFVKGYKYSIRDFKSEYYYPAQKGKQGSLVLWEFRRGWLTPCVPSTKELAPEVLVDVEEKLRELSSKSVVDFEFDPKMYKELCLNAIDDTDNEWFLQQQTRIAQQYQGGWREFMSKYGGHMALLGIGVLVFAGFVVYLDQVPSITGQCIDAGVTAAKETYLSGVVDKLPVSSGVPGG